MASNKHQFILGLVIKKMRVSGCKVKYVEGKYIGGISKNFSLPPKIFRHRPDVLGITECGQICIGDAKTDSDIRSIRTKEQIIDYTSIILNGLPCQVFLGIPFRCKDNLDKFLKDASLYKYSYLNIIYVPEEIINE